MSFGELSSGSHEVVTFAELKYFGIMKVSPQGLGYGFELALREGHSSQSPTDSARSPVTEQPLPLHQDDDRPFRLQYLGSNLMKGQHWHRTSPKHSSAMEADLSFCLLFGRED